ncbi:hypothetical protein Q4I30_000750 [Leishmania utingensis]|uniref:Uncharacterized protein n=1 Tax=Leishmania utingensis TaxID=653362 RepID=A0AAW3B242_9TRYP
MGPCEPGARASVLRQRQGRAHLFAIQREVLAFHVDDPVQSREIELELRAWAKKALLTRRRGDPARAARVGQEMAVLVRRHHPEHRRAGE